MQPQLMSCWKDQKGELHLKLIAWAIIAGFVLSVGAFLADYRDGANASSSAQFDRLLQLEQQRSGG